MPHMYMYCNTVLKYRADGHALDGTFGENKLLALSGYKLFALCDNNFCLRHGDEQASCVNEIG